MNKAEKYLNERMTFLSNERVILLAKIDETELEIKETEYKIKDLKNSIDDAFEVFSPRTRKNDFIKNEIDCLEREIDALISLRDEYKEKAEGALKDIDIIKDALRENIDEKSDENSSEYDFDEGYGINDDNNGMEKINENEKKLLADKIEKNTLQNISNLIYKCEICEKLLEVDTGRTRLEIGMINKGLSELYNNIKIITGDLRRPVDENAEAVRKTSVKKLSMNKLPTDSKLPMDS